MELVCFLVGEGHFPIYRTIEEDESQILRALFGPEFRFKLQEGDPMDELLFDVLAAMAMRSDFFFSPPDGALVVGVFELLDGEVPPPPEPQNRRHLVLVH